jgi:hypothetical protein
LDSEEELKIVDHAHGKNHTAVELAGMSHEDHDDRSARTPQNGINVQTQWSVFVDQKGNA